jgi:glutamate racemase
MNDLPIGVFDSGLGGLTVMREIASALPHEDILYFGDTARCPYGPRPLADVQEYVVQVGSWLAEHDVKLMVVACNTGTAAALPLAQLLFDVPVIGVVEPGARAAVMCTVNRKVGVIATTGTVESGVYSRAVRGLDAGVTVFSVATPRFVEVVEQGLRMGPGALEEWLAEFSDVFVRPSFYEIARGYLDPLKRVGIDTLILGCTHFPLLSAAIGQAVGPSVRLISSAEETAREVAETLAARGHVRRALPGRIPRYEFATTGDAVEFASLGSRVLRAPITAAQSVRIEELVSHARPYDREEAAAMLAAACDQGV